MTTVRLTKWGIAWAIMAVAAMGPIEVAAQEPAPARNAELVTHVRALLSGWEHDPQTADWSRLPQEAARDVLLALASDSGEDYLIQIRALASLSYFPSATTTAALLERVLDEAEADTVQRRTAILALAECDPATAVAHLDDLLVDPDPFIREAALLAVEDIDTAEVLASLERARDVETTPFLVERLDARIENLSTQIGP